MSTSAADYNAKVIDEFRANDGRVGGIWEGTPLLLLHHTGAKSGVEPSEPSRISGLTHRGTWSSRRTEERRAIPTGTTTSRRSRTRRIEVGSETIDVVAEEATGEERERLFARGADRFPDLAKHARKTDRVIPVIVLTPLGGA